jgi:D-3-phosphoglycerate dehydrogenase
VKNVLITSKEFGKQLGHEHWQKLMDLLAASGCKPIINDTGHAMSADDMLEQDKKTPLAGILVYSSSDDMSSRVIDACKELKVISRHGVGMENIDVAAAEAKGIAVLNTAAAKSEETVADLAFGLMLATARNIAAGDRAMRAGQWSRPISVDVWGKTLGIIGLGRIGKAVARRANAFSMKVLAYDVFQDVAFAEKEGVTFCSLEELLKQSDFITMHSSVTPGMDYLVGKKEFALMKESAIFINAARAKLVDYAAMREAVQAGRIGGAAIDVYETEPPQGAPWLAPKADNLISTPHIASYTIDSIRRMDTVAIKNLADTLK